MTADPRDRISEITEINDSFPADGIFVFCKAVWWGSLAAAGALLIFTVPIGILVLFDGEAAGFYIAVLPLLVSGAGTLAGMVLIGLPLTAFLHHIGRETLANYSGIGAAIGFVLPALFLLVTEGVEPILLPAGLFLGLFGMIAGGVAALHWGEYRQSQASREDAPDEFGDVGTEPHANPFHDMIH